jgi:hypothetical protein
MSQLRLLLDTYLKHRPKCLLVMEYSILLVVDLLHILEVLQLRIHPEDL